VIQARLRFAKTTGAQIEVFCLEPVEPAQHQQAFESTRFCTWRCIVGNAKKWKAGDISLTSRLNGKDLQVKATRVDVENFGFLVRFHWEDPAFTFAEIIEAAGSTPIPPYLNRAAELSDKQRYQTIYSRDLGSVAAPTAGLHFTSEMMDKLGKNGIKTQELTLHVGAGTFVPVKKENAREHAMHAELVNVSREFLEHWMEKDSLPIAVGTTSTRSLETIYWLGAKLLSGQIFPEETIQFKQWDNENIPDTVSLKQSLRALLDHLEENSLDQLRFSTSLMIVPGYKFRSIRGLITNFHQPGSTLLLLIAAFIGDDWQAVYHSALEKQYRFLSYGDSSLLLSSDSDSDTLSG
jgi:S-adenosylmethionine:tRNA ribosyltransferase-isomerase